MKIIFDQNTAEQLRDRHTLLELDTVEIQGLKKTVYCLVDEFEFQDIPQLTSLKQLHEQFITLYKQKDFIKCQELLSQLISLGFKDMNSYYDFMKDRLEKIINKEKQL